MHAQKCIFFSKTQSISLYRIGFFPLKRKSIQMILNFPECSYHILALCLRIQYTNSDNILYILYSLSAHSS